MNKKLHDNKFTFVLISLISLAISIFGLIANSIYFEYGGYSVGMACTVLLFAAFCLIYSQVNKEVKRRTIDMLFMSLFVVAIYSIITLLVDISRIPLVGMRGFSGMGIAVLVFVGIFWAITVWQIVRLVLEIFGIKIRIYEEILEGKNPFKNIFKKKELSANVEIAESEDVAAKENKEEIVVKEDASSKKTTPKEDLNSKEPIEEATTENKGVVREKVVTQEEEQAKDETDIVEDITTIDEDKKKIIN